MPRLGKKIPTAADTRKGARIVAAELADQTGIPVGIIRVLVENEATEPELGANDAEPFTFGDGRPLPWPPS